MPATHASIGSQTTAITENVGSFIMMIREGTVAALAHQAHAKQIHVLVPSHWHALYRKLELSAQATIPARRVLFVIAKTHKTLIIAARYVMQHKAQTHGVMW